MDKFDPEKQAREDKKRVEYVQALQASEGWKAITALLIQKQATWGQELLTEPGKGNEPSVQRDWWLKGAMFALSYVVDLPGVIIAGSEAESRQAESEDTTS